MNDFSKRCRWLWLFRDEEKEEEEDLPEWWIPSTKKPPSASNIIEASLDKLSKQLNSVKTEKPHYNWHKALKHDLIRFLDSRPNTMIILADKNLGYAIVNTDWYIQSCLSHLNNENNYEECTQIFLAQDEGKKAMDDIFSEVISLLKNYGDFLDPPEFRWIAQIHEWKLMRFYITAKVHKLPVKGRPILPSMTWMTFHLSEWIAAQLNPIALATGTVLKDTTELVNLIQSEEVCKNIPAHSKSIWLITADVEALYPNIDIEKGMNAIKLYLDEIEWELPERRAFLLKGLHLVLTKGYMIFNGLVKRQKNGTAMGSPMAPPYANIFMFIIERQTIKRWKDKTSLQLYKRFIDDIFTVLSATKAEVQQFLLDFNNIDPDIKLTSEISQKEVNFLDVTLNYDKHRAGIQVKVFQKPLNRYLYLPYHSYHPEHNKAGFIKGENIRYVRLSSNPKDCEQIVEQFKFRLQKRGYTLKFINQAIKNVQWNNRTTYFKVKPKSTAIPFIFKIMYNPLIPRDFLRKCLNEFNLTIKDI